MSMPQTDRGERVRLILYSAAALVVVVAGIRALEPILVPFLLAVFISILAGPPLFWLQRRGVPRALAVLLVISGVLVAMVLGVVLVGTSVTRFGHRVKDYDVRLEEQLGRLIEQLQGWGIPVSQEELLGQFDPGVAVQFAGNLIGALGAVLANAFLIALTVAFILFEATTFPAKVRATFPHADESLDRFADFMVQVNHYMSIKTWLSLATGAAVALWLWLLGVDFALMLGLVTFLLNYVPNIGSILAAIPGVLLALAQLGSTTAMLAAAGYLVVNTIIGSVIEPRVMGQGLGLSTLVVFLSLIFWGWALGPVGMVLSVPLTMMVKIALESSEETRWMAVFLGSRPSQE